MSKLKEMKLIRDLNVPSNKSFGITFAVIFMIIALFPLIKHGPVRFWAVYASAGVLAAGLFFPRVLTVPNTIWTLFGALMGKITNPLALGILFFFFVTPFSLILRLFGKDFLQLSFCRKKETYWMDKKSPYPVTKSMKSQF